MAKQPKKERILSKTLTRLGSSRVWAYASGSQTFSLTSPIEPKLKLSDL